MKRKVAIMVVAALAVVVMAVSFTACDGGSGDVKSLYDAIFGFSNQYATTTTMSAVELDDLDGADVSVSGKALIAQRTDPDTSETAYELWVNSPKEMSPLMTPVYSGDIKPKEVPYDNAWSSATADWCWVVDNAEARTITLFTIDRGKETIEYDAWSGAPSMYIERVSGGIETLFVNGEAFCEYDREKGVVTEIGETTGGDEEPTLEPEGVMIELEDVDIELVDDTVARVYDKDGNVLRLVNMENLVPGRSAEVVAATKKAVLLQELKELPADASDYDFYEGADKYAVAQYKYDWKSGKVSEADFGYVLDGSNGAGLLGMMMDVFPMEVAKIGDDKALVPGGMVLFDSDMKVVCDLDDIMPGAVSFDVVGEYLILTDGTIVRYYDSEGNVVGEYLSLLDIIEEDESGLLKKGNDWFTVSGEYLFTLGTEDAPDTKTHLASFPGKVYYAEMRLDEDGNLVLDETTEQPIADFKVYDVTSGTTATLWSTGDIVKFDLCGVYILCDEEGDCTVYDLKRGNRLTDFATDNPGSVYISAFGDDLLIEYTVTHVENNVETSESRYIFVDTNPFSPEMNCTGPTEE